MPVVIGVRFREGGKVYHFAPPPEPVEPGDWVLVETRRARDLARVVFGAREVGEEEIKGELKPALRKATDRELESMAWWAEKEEEALERCRRKVAEHGLPMKLIRAVYNYDGTHLTFFFTAEGRVDFRALVRDLARTFRTRIELRQIGDRDAAALIGDVGPCGRELCCRSWMRDFWRISTRMAKEQDLPLNPARLAGYCGRLKCCLKYEHEQYLELKAELPPLGTQVVCAACPAGCTVVELRPVKEAVVVETPAGNRMELGKRELETPPPPPVPLTSRAEPDVPPEPESPSRSSRRRRRRRKKKARGSSAASPTQEPRAASAPSEGKGTSGTPSPPPEGGGTAPVPKKKKRRRRRRRKKPSANASTPPPKGNGVDGG